MSNIYYPDDSHIGFTSTFTEVTWDSGWAMMVESLRYYLAEGYKACMDSGVRDKFMTESQVIFQRYWHTYKDIDTGLPVRTICYQEKVTEVLDLSVWYCETYGLFKYVLVAEDPTRTVMDVPWTRNQ